MRDIIIRELKTKIQDFPDTSGKITYGNDQEIPGNTHGDYIIERFQLLCEMKCPDSI